VNATLDVVVYGASIQGTILWSLACSCPSSDMICGSDHDCLVNGVSWLV